MARETEIVAQPVFTPGARIVAAPFQFLTGGEDHLRVESWNSLSGVRVAVHGRWQSARGGVRPFAFAHVPNTDRSRAQSDHALEEGFLLNLSVFASSGSPLLGQTFVSIKLIRGITGATIVLGVLLQGYVTGEQHLGWPGSPIESSTQGEPLPRTIIGTNPAAGSEISETVPTGARWNVKGMRAQLTTDATAGNRFPEWQYVDGGTILVAAIPSTVQATGSTKEYVMFHGAAPAAAPLGQALVFAIPEVFWLPAGFIIRTVTSNFAAGDNWTAPALSVQEPLGAD